MQEITGKGFQIPAKPPSVPSPAHGKLKSALRNRHGLGGEEGNEDPVLLPAAGDPPKKITLRPKRGSWRGAEIGSALPSPGERSGAGAGRCWGGPTREATGPCLGASLGSSGHPWEPPAPQDPHGGLQLLRGGLPAVWASSQKRRGGGDKPAVKPNAGDACAGLGAIRGTRGQPSRPCPLGSAPALNKSKEGRLEGCFVQG